MKNTTKMILAGSVLTAAAAAAGCYVGLKSVLDMVAKRDSPLYERSLGKTFAEHAENSPYAEVLQEGADWLSRQPLEPVRIESHDGLKLKGHLLTCPEAKRTEILFHGWRELWSSNFGLMTRYLHENATNVLIVEQRSQGESEGEYIGFGVLERYDCQRWAEYAAERFPELPIYLGGISMGATTVLMAAGLELPEQVHGIIADCGFTSPRAILAHVLTSRTSLPEKPLLPLLSLLSRKAAGYKLEDCSTVEALQNSTIPVLFVHGDADRFVPLAMTLESYLACSAPKELLIVENAKHGESFLLDGPGYKAALQTFFENND